jgi:hypothetical protein
LAALIKQTDSSLIIDCAFVIGDVPAIPILDIGQPKCLLVGKVAYLNEETKIRIVVGSEPGDRPMPASATDDLVINSLDVANTSNDRGDVLLALR